MESILVIDNNANTTSITTAPTAGDGPLPQRPKIFLSRPDIPAKALEQLEAKFEIIKWEKPCICPREFFLANIHGVDAIFCGVNDKINEETLNAAGPNLKVVSTMSVGHDHMDIQLLRSRNIAIGHTPVVTEATAELTVAILLAATRRLFEAHEELITNRWVDTNWNHWSSLCSPTLVDSTVGFFGVGRIGRAVMTRLVPFKVAKFLFCDPFVDEVPGAQKTDFTTLCSTSDFIIVNCVLTSETKEVFNSAAFSLMKPTAIFINTSRGSVVKQVDLIEALKNHTIFGAGLDVMSPEPLPATHELTKLKNCVLAT